MLILAGRVYDMYTTSMYTPALDKELNPVVKFLGAGWTFMIALQLLLSLLIIACLYYYMFRFKPQPPEQPGLSRKELISYMMYGDIHSFSGILWRLPRSKGFLIASTGYVASGILIGISYIVGTSTLMLIYSPAYRSWYALGIPGIFYMLIVLLAAYFYYQFFNAYYRQYQQDVRH